MSREGDRLAAIMERHITGIIGKKPRQVALLLSGGIDSTAVGIAAARLGHSVNAYTFQIGNEPSYDSKWAERTAEKMGWDWQLIRLPDDVRYVIRHWPRMYFDLKCRKKREFECTWPFLFVYPRVRETHVLSGLNADAFFALGRKAVKLGASGRNSNREAFDELRRGYCFRLARDGMKALSPEYNPSCMYQHLLMQRAEKKVDVNPFLSRDAYKFFMGYSWQELNLPKQKRFIRETYPEEFALVGARNHQNYQKAGRVSEHFEKLLDTEVNFRQRGRTIDMFGDWWRASSARDAAAVAREIKRGMAR